MNEMIQKLLNELIHLLVVSPYEAEILERFVREVAQDEIRKVEEKKNETTS